MPPRIFLTLPVAALCLALASCSKSGSQPNNPPTDSTTTTGTMNINCTLPVTGMQTELVLSEPGGKILLDTVTTNAGPMIAALKTNDTLLDITLVVQASAHRFFASVYKSINPSRLTSLIMYSFEQVYTPAPSTSSTIVYYNVPAALTNYTFGPNGTIAFTYYYAGASTSQGSPDPSHHTIRYTYTGSTGNYAYLLFPQLGLCKLHLQQHAVDSVDCTTMDTAVALTFNRPFPFTTLVGASTLYAIPDTNDLANVISYTSILQPIGQGLDFQYDPFPAEKYEMNYLANNNDNDFLYYYAYTKTLPNTLPLFQSSDYSVSSSQSDNFSVTFPGSRPSYYELAYGDTVLSYSLWASPDTTTLHPLTFLTNKKCKLLQNVAITTLPQPSLSMTNFNGLDYAGYFQYITNQAAIKTKPIAYMSMLMKQVY